MLLFHGLLKKRTWEFSFEFSSAKIGNAWNFYMVPGGALEYLSFFIEEPKTYEKHGNYNVTPCREGGK